MSTTQKYIIVKDRIEIYKDFTINLLNYIIAFYLDKETLKDDIDIDNHYNWCFNKVCEEFNKEGLDFSNNKPLREYFHQFYYYQYYKRENQENALPYYEKFWRNIFENIDKQKNKNIMNTMIELYNIFDTSVNHEKNILEIV
jgi:hypothetical protein